MGCDESPLIFIQFQLSIKTRIVVVDYPGHDFEFIMQVFLGGDLFHGEKAEWVLNSRFWVGRHVLGFLSAGFCV